jgi:plasmid stabilization system protein ParE
MTNNGGVKGISKAEDDLLEIGLYTSQKWGVMQRNRYLDDINARFYQLSDNAFALRCKSSVCALIIIAGRFRQAYYSD